MAIANASQAVFRPAKCPRTRVIMREIFPGGTVGTVVLANGAPGTFAKVRAPALPMLFSLLNRTELTTCLPARKLP
jgi:hypothetical protein